MGAIRITDGSASVTITGDLAEKMRARVLRAEGSTARVVDDALDIVAAEARREWYGVRGVEERTGISGEIDVVTTIDAAKAEARAAIGSRATALVGGKPRAVYIHSRGVFSTTLRAVDPETYWRTPKALQFAFRRPKGWRDDPGKPAQQFPAIKVGAEGAGTGYGFLLEKLVKAPTRKAIKALIPKIAAAATGG